MLGIRVHAQLTMRNDPLFPNTREDTRWYCWEQTARTDCSTEHLHTRQLHAYRLREAAYRAFTTHLTLTDTPYWPADLLAPADVLDELGMGKHDMSGQQWNTGYVFIAATGMVPAAFAAQYEEEMVLAQDVLVRAREDGKFSADGTDGTIFNACMLTYKLTHAGGPYMLDYQANSNAQCNCLLQGVRQKDRP